MERGVLFVVTAPSGAGKTTLCDRILENHPDVEYSISMTTRPPRRGEVDGRDYFFVTVEVFEKAIERGEFLEYAKVYDNYYGTRKDFIEERLAQGKSIIMDIDVQGALNVKKQDNPAVFIYIVAPSMEELERRLRGRKTDAEEVIAKRLSKAREEMAYYGEYDYVVVNDDLDEAYDELVSILKAERCRAFRKKGFMDRLLS